MRPQLQDAEVVNTLDKTAIAIDAAWDVQGQPPERGGCGAGFAQRIPLRLLCMAHFCRNSRNPNRFRGPGIGPISSGIWKITVIISNRIKPTAVILWPGEDYLRGLL